MSFVLLSLTTISLRVPSVTSVQQRTARTPTIVSMAKGFGAPPPPPPAKKAKPTSSSTPDIFSDTDTDDEASIKGMIKRFASDTTGQYMYQNSAPGALFIRPSGNPIRALDYAAFLTGPVKVTDAALIELHMLDVGTDMALAAFTHSATFTYEGNENSDPSYTITMAFKRIDGLWKISWAHRSSAPSDLSTWAAAQAPSSADFGS